MLHPTAPHFDLAEYLSLPRQYAPMYAWAWNGPVSREKTDAQLAEMAALGVRAFYIIPEPKCFRPTTFATLMEPDYLTPAYFEEFRYTTERARELGMECWLYDEGGWPSGGACGQVLREYPHLARRSLRTRDVTVPAGEAYRRTDADVVAAFVDTDRLIAEGDTFAADTTVTEYYSHVHLFETPGIPDYPDLLLPESTQRFLEMTHDRYAAHMGELLGTSLTACFTDEPNMPRHIAMRQELLTAFEAEYGESVIPALPAMIGKCKPDFHQGELIANWFDLCSRWFCDHYLKAERDWCRAHGMAFTGHFDKDDEPGCLRVSGNANPMRALRCLDIPGIDVIWRQICPGEYGKSEGIPPWSINGFFPRQASSAAYQNGTRWAMTESFGVYGPGLTYDLMRYVTNFQAVRGVSIMNPMFFAYHRRGSLRIGEMPNFDGVQPYYEYLPDYNRYAERVTYLTTLGERVCDTALYFPARDISVDFDPAAPNMPVAEAQHYDRMGRALEDAGVDFDIIDDDFLREAALDGGALAMGLAKYRTIYVPKCRYMPAACKQVLEAFEQAGGKVYYDEIPAPVPAHELSTGYQGIRLMKRVSDRGEMLLIFNENTVSTEVSLRMDGENVYILDPATGSITRSGRNVSLTLPSGDMVAVYAAAEALPGALPFAGTRELAVTGFTLQPVRQFRLTYNEMEAFDLSAPARPTALGDWQEVLGRDFSGVAVYEATFPRPDAGQCVIDLGDVRHACTVSLNGTELGRRIAPPWRFEVPAGLLREENVLTVRVTNTSANEYHYTDVFDKWPGWMIPVYVKYQMEYDKDSLPSGLFGPVRVEF